MKTIETSHLKLLQTNGVNLNNIRNDNVDAVLSKLKTIRGNSLSGNYKTSILNTIKKLPNSKVTINKSQLSWTRNRSKKDRITVEFMKCIHNILTYVYNYEPHKNVQELLSMIDTIIAILFITSTNIKTNDIYSVTLEEFDNLNKNNNFHLVINGKKLVVSPLLASQAFKKIEILLKYKSENFEDIILKNLNKEKKIKLNNYLISTAASQINKTIHRLYIKLNFLIMTDKKNKFNNEMDDILNEVESNSLGLQVFRRFNQDIIHQLISTNI